MHPLFYPLNLIDYPITEFLNRFAQTSYSLDMLDAGFEGDPLVKGGIVATFLWWAWFRPSQQPERDRSYLISGIVASTFAIAVARLLALSLPFRARPRFTPELHFRLPYGSDNLTLLHWSSFPSDHAALFFCLAAAIFQVSRRAGWICYAYVALLIALPRLYGGTHFFSDLLCGALIGIFTATVFFQERIRLALARHPLHWLKEYPSRFYSSAFLLMLLVASNFDLLRKVGTLMLHAMHILHETE